MIVLSRAMNTNRWNPLRKAAAKIKNLEKKPANGGMPARENSASVIVKASFGLVLYSPL